MTNQILIDENRKADFSMPYNFPLKVYETDLKYKPHGVNEWHWHDEFQFSTIIKGTVAITVQGKNYVLKESEGIFINAGRLHTTRSLSKEKAKYLCINIHPSMFSFFHGSLMEQKYFLPYLENNDLNAVVLTPDLPWQKKILNGQHCIHDIMSQKNHGYELEVYIQMMELWKNLVINISAPSSRETTSFQTKEIKKILLYIQEHYAEPISLSDIANISHVSKSWCCRMFKRTLNCTVFEYLTEYRIQKSTLLLTTTSLSVTQIAYLVGFSDTSYFIKKFSQIMHMTPLSYRKKACDGFSLRSEKQD